MKLKTIFILVTTTLFLMVGNVAAAPAVRLFVAGQQVTGDVPPIVIEGRALVPVRVLAEAMGFSVTWDPSAQSVALSKGERQIVLTIGRSEALVDGRPVALDMPATVEQGRTLIPVRFVAEQLEAEVTWDPSTSEIHVTPKTAPSKSGESTASLSSPSKEAIGRPQAFARLDEALARDNVRADSTLSFKMGVADGSFSMTMTVDQTLYNKGPEMLEITKTRLFGSEEVTGTAVRAGTVWKLSSFSDGWVVTEEEVSRDWILGEGLGNAFDLADLPEEELANATVKESKSALDGQPYQVVTLSWGPPMAAAIVGAQVDELREGKMNLTFWIDATGFIHRLDIEILAIEKSDEGGQMEITGRVLFTPWTQPIPFPDEIQR